MLASRRAGASFIFTDLSCTPHRTEEGISLTNCQAGSPPMSNSTECAQPYGPIFPQDVQRRVGKGLSYSAALHRSVHSESGRCDDARVLPRSCLRIPDKDSLPPGGRAGVCNTHLEGERWPVTSYGDALCRQIHSPLEHTQPAGGTRKLLKERA